MSSVTLNIGGARIQIAGLNPEQWSLVDARFGALNCRDDAPTDARIDVHTVPDPSLFMRRPQGPSVYRLAVAHDEQGVALAGIGFTANLDRTPLRVQLQTCFSNEWFLGALDNVLRVVASYQVFEHGGVVMHSAAFVHGERGFLFCGRSGAGKTTLCELAAELELGILSDELNAVVATAGGLTLMGMPFAGDFGGAPQAHPPYPLTGLFGLTHGARPELLDCSKAEAVSRIVAACPYVNTDPALLDTLTERAVRLVSETPFRILSFAKSTSFWSVLHRETRSLDPLPS